MSTVSYAGALLAVSTFLSGPILGQAGTENGGAKNARVQHVVVRDNEGATEVEIQTSGGPVAPNTQAITGPDRIVVDFPGATPAPELSSLAVNRGALKGIRAGLFFSNPPITRIVLDLSGPQAYQISTIQNGVVVRLSADKLNPQKRNPTGLAKGRIKLDLGQSTLALVPMKRASVASATPKTIEAAPMPAAKLQSASLESTSAASINVNVNVASSNVASPSVAAPTIAVEASETAPPPAEGSAPLPPMPSVTVSFVNGMLRIHAEKATLAEVLFEVHRQTRAEIAIPAGAEREQVMADLGPAPARDVLSALKTAL